MKKAKMRTVKAWAVVYTDGGVSAIEQSRHSAEYVQQVQGEGGFPTRLIRVLVTEAPRKRK